MARTPKPLTPMLDLLTPAPPPKPPRAKPAVKKKRKPVARKPKVEAAPPPPPPDPLRPDPTKPPLLTPLPGERKYARPKPTVATETRNVPITMPPRYPWQDRVWAALHDPVIRFVVVSKGQQIGGSFLGGEWLVEGALQGENSWWVAPDYTLSEVGYDFLADLNSQPPFDRIMRMEKKIMRFNVENAGKKAWIRIRSADDPNKLISRTLHRMVVDEFALMSPDAWEGKLSERLTLYRGKALIIFNPHGKNHAWELWRKGDPDNPNRDPEWMSFKFSQYDNPNISRADIEKKRQTYTRARFQSEVMGEFVDSGGEVFVNIREQSRIGFVNGGVSFDPTHHYVGGLDISGGRHDWHVMMIEDVTLHAQVAMIRFSTPELEVMKQRFLQAQDAWGLESTDGDETTIGIFPMREFQNAGLRLRAVNLNTVTKRELIESYAAAIELGQLRLLNDPQLVLEHEAYQAEETASGYVRYNSPKGGTDDIVIAGALAHRAASVYDAPSQPSFVRGTYTGLYGNHLLERTYPSWTRVTAPPLPRRPGDHDFPR